MPAPDVAEPPRGFSLSDFGGPDAPPDELKHGETIPDKPADTPAAPETAPEPDETEQPETEKTEPKPAADNGKPGEEAGSLMDAMDGVAIEDEKAKKAEADRLAAEKKAQEEAAEKAKAEQAAATSPERDADLNVTHGPNTHPKTRKVITEFQAKAKAARDERDAVIAEREALKRERDQLAEQAKTIKVPKETEEEIKTLRERVRELDIAKDPELVTRFDKRIEANNVAIVEVLKANGLGSRQDKDGKTLTDPALIDQFVKRGINAQTIYPMVVRLRKAAAKYEEEGNEGASIEAQKGADDLLTMLRENEGIAREKQSEIEKWKGGYDQRIQQREQQSKQAQTERQQAIATHSRTILGRDIEALAKEIPFLRKPAGPQPGDAPNVAKAKQAAVDEYTAAEAKINAELKTLQIDGVPPEKFTEVAGRISANASQAVIFKTFVVPKLLREAATSAARIKELEAQIASYENAGKLSRIHGGGASPETRNGAQEAVSLEDALGRGPS
jgi:hypothetical protein